MYNQDECGMGDTQCIKHWGIQCFGTKAPSKAMDNPDMHQLMLREVGISILIGAADASGEGMTHLQYHMAQESL
jgi:hypothetical protein